MTILVKKVFISSKPTFVYLLCPPLCGPFSIQESAAGGLSYKVSKNVPRHILVRVRIIGTFRGISYCTKKPGKIIPAIFSKAPQNTPAAAPKTPYIPQSADERTLKSLRAVSAPGAYTDILPGHRRHPPRADVQCLPYGRGSGAFYPFPGGTRYG